MLVQTAKLVAMNDRCQTRNLANDEFYVHVTDSAS
jgi:hypothetical protein